MLHRDIKPGNIMLGKYGETLVVDWGLAKVDGQVARTGRRRSGRSCPSRPAASAETMAGIGARDARLHEPRAGRGRHRPARPAVRRLQPRRDAVLPAVGRPPFEADDVGAVLQAVSGANSRRPGAFDPSIDPALEAICLKAMALKPEDRYASARSLAEDVERWMADEPVGAHREPASRRLARWARRNSAMVTGAGALLGAAVIALAAIAWLVTRQNMRLDRARREADEQRDRARDSTAMASRAVTEMLDRVARKDLMNVPQAEPLRVELAERALSLYRELDAKNPEDPETRCRLATIEEEVARLYRMIGKHDRAAEVYDSALSHFRDLVAALPRRAQVFPSPGEHPGTVRRATQDARPHRRGRTPLP